MGGRVYHHLRDSIEAHLTICSSPLAVSRWIVRQTGWLIRNFVKTARRYRTIQIQAGAEHRATMPAYTRPIARASMDRRLTHCAVTQ